MDGPDLIIVGAKEESFQRCFIEERSWYPVRIDYYRIKELKWIAVYQIIPISAITHMAKIKEIQEYKDYGRYQIKFDEIIKLERIIKIDPNTKYGFQGQRYSWVHRINESQFISDLKPWG